jgi:hypothetical protein
MTDQVEEMYNITEEILEEYRKGETNTFKMADQNSVAGNKSRRNIAGPHGLGRISQRGQMLTDYCEWSSLIITNTCFKKPKRRLYTWKAPDRSQYQLDYIRVCTRLKKIIKFQKEKSRWDQEKLHAH